MPLQSVADIEGLEIPSFSEKSKGRKDDGGDDIEAVVVIQNDDLKNLFLILENMKKKFQTLTLEVTAVSSP